MNPTSRISMLAGVAVGLLLIAYGSIQSSSSGTAGPESAQTSTETGDFELSNLDRRAQPIESLAAPSALPGKATEGPRGPGTSVLVHAIHLRDSTPCYQAKVSLWRESTGEGPSFRPARRLTELLTDAEGRVSFSATPSVPLELFAQAAGSGPLVKLRLGELQPGETRTAELVLERPPEPLDIRILDDATSEPIAGAAVRLVAIARQNLGLEDFPGTTRLAARTGADGTATLEGPARKTRWLLIDAAGYSPLAVRPNAFDGIPGADIRLPRAAQLDCTVLQADGQPARGVVVRLVASLGDFRTTFTGSTSRSGEVSFRRLPVNVPLVPEADVEGSAEGSVDTQLFDAITLDPGEERAIQRTLR